MSTDSFINSTPLEQLREFLKLQNENASLKIEIKLLNERLKTEEEQVKWLKYTTPEFTRSD